MKQYGKADVTVYDLSTGEVWTNVKKLRPKHKPRLPRKLKKKFRTGSVMINTPEFSRMNKKFKQDLFYSGHAEMSFNFYAKPTTP